MTAEEVTEYHLAQVVALVQARVGRIAAMTALDVAKPTGVVHATRQIIPELTG